MSPHITREIDGLLWVFWRKFNTLRPRQNGRRFADDTFKRIFLNKNVRISIKISLKFVPKGPINNIPSLVQIMAWRRPGDKPLSEPMMVNLLTHICVTRPQWVNQGTPYRMHEIDRVITNLYFRFPVFSSSVPCRLAFDASWVHGQHITTTSQGWQLTDMWNHEF